MVGEEADRMMKSPGSLPGTLLCMRARIQRYLGADMQAAGVRLTQFIITAVEAQIQQEPEY